MVPSPMPAALWEQECGRRDCAQRQGPREMIEATAHQPE